MCWGDNDYGQLGDGTCCADSSTPAMIPRDVDLDGCLDITELGPNAGLGGSRNPKDRWDFFDVPTDAPPVRDRNVSIGDVGGIVGRYGAYGDPGGDPLAPPPAAPAYHTAYDRGGITPGGEPWNLLPPDGMITVGDIGAVVSQFGHSCA